MSDRWKPRLSRVLLGCAALYLFVDFLTLPESAGVKRLIEDCWERLLPRARSSFHPWTVDATIHRNERVLTLDFEYERYRDADRVGDAWVNPSRRLYGWWAPTSEGFRTELHIFPDSSGASFDDAEVHFIRTQFANHIQSLPLNYMFEFAQWIREERQIVIRPLFWGYIRNGIATLCATIILVSMIHSGRHAMIRARRSRLLNKGCCPQCQYDLRGDMDAGCPECGWRREGDSRTMGRRT